jgi:hypothetical protein
MEPEASLPCPQESAIGLCPESRVSSPHLLLRYILIVSYVRMGPASDRFSLYSSIQI